MRLPVRGSQCLPSIPGGLFCHRLCAARHGRGRRQRVGQPSPTAVLLHPGTQRHQANMKTNSRPSLQLIFLCRGKKISLDNITYSRLCTENLAVHRSRSNFSLCWEQLSSAYSSPCAYRSVQSNGEVGAKKCNYIFLPQDEGVINYSTECSNMHLYSFFFLHILDELFLHC